MDTLLGVVGRDFVIAASDSMAVRSILVYKSDEDKTRKLTDHILLLFSGEAGDTVNVSFFFSHSLSQTHNNQQEANNIH